MLRIIDVNKTFGVHEALRHVSIDIQRGEFFSLLGPSGCGKTTLLRILAGFEHFSTGDIVLDGKSLKNVPPEKRPFNLVFQKYALFPHLSVWDNVAFGPKINGKNTAEIKASVNEALELVKMQDFLHRRVTCLSGGQQQRVGLARAIVNRPKVLLLDECLSALDLQLRKQMQFELHALQRKLGITFIFVTHDQEEAMHLSDRMAVLNNGVVEQVGTPEEIYERPKTEFVASFIGSINKLHVDFVSHDIEESPKLPHSKLSNFKLINGHIIKSFSTIELDAEKKCLVLLRPERLRIKSRANGAKNNVASVSGKIKDIFFRGDTIDIVVTTDDSGLPDLLVALARTSISTVDQLPPLQRDQKVHVWWNFEDSIALARTEAYG